MIIILKEMLVNKTREERIQLLQLLHKKEAAPFMLHDASTAATATK